MPNHCFQSLKIRGNPLQIKEMFANVGEDDLLISANKIIPYPAKYKKLDEQAKTEHAKGNYSFKSGFTSGGHAWCIENWGTKWGLYNFGPVSFADRSATLIFNSAWSPGSPIIRALSENYPNFRFELTYEEPGFGFEGFISFQNGSVLEQYETTYVEKEG